VLYEIEMLFRTSDQLTAELHADFAPPHEVAMALIESFAIHARALIHFLWRDRGHPEDGFAAEYFVPGGWAELRPDKEATIRGIDDRVGAEIAHISYKRIRVTDDERWWRYGQIAASIGRCLREFIKHAPGEMLIENFRSRAWHAMPVELRVPIAMSWPADDQPRPVATAAFPLDAPRPSPAFRPPRLG